MSQIPISYLIDDAAAQIGDPNKTRVTATEWLAFFNRAQRQLCEKADVLKFRGLFTIDPTTQIYAYPETATVITAVEVTETPADETTFKFLDEKFEDEFREVVSAAYPTGSIPDRYFADTGWFYLIPWPQTQYVQGGRVTFYGLPDRVTDPSGTVQVPALAQDYLLDRMVIFGLYARHRDDEAGAAYALWLKELETLTDKFEDRSRDRRTAIRARRNPFAGMN